MIGLTFASLLMAAGLECWAPTVSDVAPSLSARERTGVPPLARQLDRAEQLLRTDARINALGGTRVRLHRFIGHPASGGAPLMADASVWLHRRPSTWGPQCTLLRGSDYTHHAALSAHFNQLDPLYHLLENPQAASTDSAFTLPEVVDTVQGVPVYGHREFGARVLLLTRDGVPPLVRVTGDSMRWRVNPMLFAGATPGAVRVIALALTMSDGGDPQRAQLEQWLREMNLAPWREMLTGLADVGQPSLVNLLTRDAGASVVGFSSEFGAGWIADNLVPTAEQLTAGGKPLHDLVWSSASSAPFPHWVTLDLGKRQWLTTLVFNNALSEEPDHPGISARLIEVHVGNALDALRKVASFELQRNRNDQAVQVAPVEARYIKFLVRSNWGHPWYTELGASMVYDNGMRPESLAVALAAGGRADVYGIYFDFAGAAVRAESRAAIDEIAAWARANPGRSLRIEGHTDNVGGDAVNTLLSQQRADAVVAELVKRGIPASRLSARGLGSRQPVASNGSEAGRARNRRVSVEAPR
jgi:outer membrane protein OmpA-like peptidoglycan-associated protein